MRVPMHVCLVSRCMSVLSYMPLIPILSSFARVSMPVCLLTHVCLSVYHRIVKKDLNMFDQPYRQHWSVAKGQGHQVISIY